MIKKRKQSHGRLQNSPGGFGKPEAPDTNGQIDVIHGIYSDTFPLAGQTVASAKKQLMVWMNIHPKAKAVVNGKEVPETYSLQEDDILTFVRPPGKKAGDKAWERILKDTRRRPALDKAIREIEREVADGKATPLDLDRL